MRIKTAVAVITLAVATTLTSVIFQRPYPAAIGNLCERTTENPNGLCYRDLPAGGFPFAYLFDSPTTSVIGSLGAEDALNYQHTFQALPFLADVTIFAIVFAALWRLIRPHGTRQNKR